MPEKQRTVDVIFKTGKKSKGIATGSNAAWICKCGRTEPLLGRSGDLKRAVKGFCVDCPSCLRKYFIVPEDKDHGPVLMVIQIDN